MKDDVLDVLQDDVHGFVWAWVLVAGHKGKEGSFDFFDDIFEKLFFFLGEFQDYLDGS